MLTHHIHTETGTIKWLTGKEVSSFPWSERNREWDREEKREEDYLSSEFNV